MKKYNFVFIVLTYKNFKDLIDFRNSLHNIHGTYKIIVVNSFFDEDSMNSIKQICEESDFDFLNIKNKGYSYGNNYGVDFAKNSYLFDFLVISNPDIEIQYLNYKLLSSYDECIIGPKILNKFGKNQNPVYYKRLFFVEKIQKYSIKKNNYGITYIAALYNKINKFINYIFKDLVIQNYEVYALHGSFLILSDKAISLLDYKPFNDNMFLFAEEDYLAYIAKKIGIRMVYCKNSIIKHKEDGSMRLSNLDLRKIALESLNYVYLQKSKNNKI